MLTTCFALTGLIAWKHWLDSTLRNFLFTQSTVEMALRLTWPSPLIALIVLGVFTPNISGAVQALQPSSQHSELRCYRIMPSQSPLL